MYRITSCPTKLTEEHIIQKKLNFCQSHFSRVAIGLVIIAGLLVGAKPAYAQEDDFQELPLAEEPASSPTEKSGDSLNLPTDEPAAAPVSEAEPSLENEPPSETVAEDLPAVEQDQFPVDNLVEVQGSDSPLVEVRQRFSSDTPYRDRRDTFGWVFSIGTENLFMPDYLSLLDDNYYEDLFGDSDLSFFQLGLGFKYNFSLGSMALSAGYAMGSITDNRVGDERRLELSKPYADLSFYLDTFMKEPYVVPYVGAQVWSMNVKEESVGSEIEDSLTTDIGFSFKVGLLFQLNWLDTESAREAYNDFHIQNTYLDIFAIQNTETQGEDDPNLSSDFNWGAGLKIEF